MKTFYLKLLTILIILLGIYISITYYLGYTQTKNFQIINEKQSLIIQLPNTQYIEINSRNDHVIDTSGFNENPFSINTKIQKNSNLENSIVRTNTSTEYVENGDSSSRYVSITPTNTNQLDIEIISRTAYIYKDNLKYNIQLDYSNKTEYVKEDNYVYWEDKGCRVEIHDDQLDYEISENEQSIVLSRAYDLEVEYDIKMVINCNK